MSLDTTSMEIPPHVTVEHAAALFSVRCACGSWVVIYQYTLRKDPDALRREVESHTGCARRAA